MVLNKIGKKSKKKSKIKEVKSNEDLNQGLKTEEETNTNTKTKKRQFIKEEDKAKLKKGKRKVKVDLNSEEQKELLERMKLEEIEKDIKYWNKKKPLNYVLYKIFSTTPITHILIYYIVFVIITSVYLIYTTQNTVLSVVIGLLISMVLTNSFLIKRERANRHMDNLFKLSAYSTTLVHYLKTGNGLLVALRDTRDSIEGDVKYDIINTINIMESTGELNTRSFDRYKSKNISVFHKILEIFYWERSTNAGDMFENVLKSISKEVEDKNKLKRMKETRAMQLYVMTGMALAVPLIIAFSNSQNYEVFIAPFYVPYLVAIYFSVMAWVFASVHNKTLKNDLL